MPAPPRRRARARTRGAALLVLALLAAACAGPSHPARHRSSPTATRTATASPTPFAKPLVPVTNWQVNPAPETVIEGFANRVQVDPGRPVTLYVSTSAPTFTVTALRMGWYGSTAAARIWASPALPGRVQPPAAEIPATRTDYAPWRPSLTIQTAGWPPGDYLFRLAAATGPATFVPLTIVSPSFAGRVVLVNAVTTWAAYNTWGGRSLYSGPTGYASRAYAVSFDRPYATGQGAAAFLQTELPLLTLAAQLHLPLGYATDVTLETDPAAFRTARAILSPGHDEYYSQGMRNTLTAARAAGVNIAFLGANAIYRHIRFGPTPLGPDRLVIDYKDFSLDPVHTTDPAAATTRDWSNPPDPRPESVLTGAMYQCNPVHDRLVVGDPSSWLLAGLHLHRGQAFGYIVGTEYDAVDLAYPTPRPMEVVFHSPLSCENFAPYSDVTYYTVSSGAGVFDASTSNWVCSLSGVCGPGWGDAATDALVRAVTARLLRAFAAGPAGRAHPAVDNLATFGYR